jgi:tRNA-splicing ligase RtcB
MSSMSEIPITVKGEIEPRAVEQLRRCAEAGDAVAGAICADGHVGYSQPIGGVLAYPDHISPSGVGYDIACIAAGTRVTTRDGYTLAIEDVRADAAVMCWDGRVVRTATPVAGAVARGTRPTSRVLLRNGRELRCTNDHRIRTPLGWRAAGLLQPGDRLACLPYVGLPFVAAAGEIALEVTRTSARTKLRSLGLLPLRATDPRLPALMRVLGVICGDGHLSRDGKAVSCYTVVPADAATIADDIARIGFRASVHTRSRAAGRRDEHCVRVRSVALHALLAGLGCPIGRKVDCWPRRPMRWLFDVPPWLRAQFLSGFASAEATTPALRSATLAPPAIKQAGTTRNAIGFVEELFESLGFRVGVSVSGPTRGDVTTWVAQIVGGIDEQLRFLREVGFCHAADKRCAGAVVSSVAWQAAVARDRRSAAIAEAGCMRAAGDGPVRAVCETASEAFGVPRALVHQGLYGRGQSRVGRTAFSPDTSGEVVWVEIACIEPAGRADVYDVITGDEAQAFQAAGICVHNCGNKAVRTDLRTDDIRQDVPRIMDDVFRRISFGVGRNNNEPVEHPVIDAIGRAEFGPQRKMVQMARNQLGTVGAGNHYVDLFAGDDGFVWVGVHFGSRGFGHKTASGFLALAAGRAFDERGPDGEMDSPPVLLHVNSELGQDYIAAMNLAGEYAYAGRDVVVGKVLEILGAQSTYEVHNHHNFAWRESHLGTDVWVVRKGCTPAFPGQEGFVGATMGEPSVILRGTDSDEGAGLLYSTVHGAGRVMSRTKAAGRMGNRAECTQRDCDFWVTWAHYRYARERAGVGAREDYTLCPLHPDGRMAKRRGAVKPGEIDFDAVQAQLTGAGIELRGGAADEAPAAYKRLDAVLEAPGDTIEILHRLTPIGVAMARADTFDPYKD